MRPALLAALALALVPSASLGQQATAPAIRTDDGTLISREPYAFPFSSRSAWFDDWRKRPNGAATIAGFSRLFGEADYAGWAAGRTTRTSRITYRSSGLAIKGLLVEPRVPGRHPIVIYNHGGICKYGRLVFWDILEMNRIAARGYVVLASQFRGENGSEGACDYGGGDADDALALIDVAKRLPGADADRVGTIGFSRGGLTTYTALARSRRVAAAVVVGGPVDLTTDPRRAEFDRYVYPDAIPGYRTDPAGELARRSPIRWPERLAPGSAILILQGGDDPRVAPAGALAMAAALQKLHRSYRLKIYEGGDHDLFADFIDARVEIDRWFDRYVRDGMIPPANGVAVLPPEVTQVP